MDIAHVERQLKMKKLANMAQVMRERPESPNEDKGLNATGTRHALEVENLDRLIALAEYDKAKRRGSYLFNPFAPGPITEGIDRLRRRYHTARGNANNPDGVDAAPQALLGAGIGGLAGGLGGAATGVLHNALTPTQTQLSTSQMGSALAASMAPWGGGVLQSLPNIQLGTKASPVKPSMPTSAGKGALIGALGGGGLGALLAYLGAGGGSDARHGLRTKLDKMNVDDYSDVNTDEAKVKTKELGRLAARYPSLDFEAVKDMA